MAISHTLGKFNATDSSSSAYATDDYSVTLTALTNGDISPSVSSINLSRDWTTSASATVDLTNVDQGALTINSIQYSGTSQNDIKNLDHINYLLSFALSFNNLFLISLLF